MLGLIFNSMLLLIPIIRREKEELLPAQQLCGPSPSKVPGSAQQMGMTGAEGIAHLVMLLFTAL